MRLWIKRARPTILNMAVRHAVELEAFNKAERKHLEGQGFMRATNQQETKKPGKHDELKTLKDSMFKMQRTLESLTCRNDANDRSDKIQPQPAFKTFGQRSGSTQEQQNTKRKFGSVALKRTLDATAHRQKRKLHQKTRINR